MSEGSNVPRPKANKSFLHSERGLRSIERLKLSPASVATNALKDISNSVRKKLETAYSSDSELDDNVVTAREFPFTSFDESLFQKQNNSTDLDQLQRQRERPNVINFRNLSSLSSSTRDVLSIPVTESSIENTDASDEEISKMDRESEITPPHQPSNAHIDAEIAHLSNIIALQKKSQSRIEQTRAEQSRTKKGNDAILDTLNELRAAVLDLSGRISLLEVRNPVFNRQTDNDLHNVPEEIDQTYGRTESDIRYRRSTAANYISLKEARTMIPEFDGSSRHKLQDFLNSCKYAMQNIKPADEDSLIQAILYTKLRGKARQDFETRDIRTFAEFKQQ